MRKHGNLSQRSGKRQRRFFIAACAVARHVLQVQRVVAGAARLVATKLLVAEAVVPVVLQVRHGARPLRDVQVHQQGDERAKVRVGVLVGAAAVVANQDDALDAVAQKRGSLRHHQNDVLCGEKKRARVSIVALRWLLFTEPAPGCAQTNRGRRSLWRQRRST